MSELISNEDALRALANNFDVEFKCGGSSWRLLDSKQQPVEILIDPFVKFRLKPRTVKLEIEVPAPFEPKVGDMVWFISSDNTCGYSHDVFGHGLEEKCIQYGAWRTKPEIIIVVEQLQKLGALK